MRKFAGKFADLYFRNTYESVRTIGAMAYFIAALCLVFILGYQAGGEEEHTIHTRLREAEDDDELTSILRDDPE